jgi:hypothetical protein
MSHGLEEEDIFASSNGWVFCFFDEVVFERRSILWFNIKEDVTCFGHRFIVFGYLVAMDQRWALVGEDLFPSAIA